MCIEAGGDRRSLKSAWNLEEGSHHRPPQSISKGGYQVPDTYAAIRSLSFPALAIALAIDITKFKVRKSGQEHYGPCPVHKPKNNQTSFSYLSDGLFNCFSCGAKGRGAVDLVKLARNVGFRDAVALLEPLAGKMPAKEKSPAEGHANRDAANRMSIANASASNGGVRSIPGKLPESESITSTLTPLTAQYHKFAVPCPWLEARVPDAGIRDRYGVFCYDNPKRKSAYSGRVMIPVKDAEGILYGYLGRMVQPTDTETPEPKYLFPKNLPKSKFLFGAAELWEGRPHRKVYLVESPFAAMKFASLGLPAVAAYGAFVSDEQLELLTSLAKGVLYFPDRDKYQQVDSTIRKLAQALWLRFPSLPAGVDDPEFLTKEQILGM
jgi:DNA primase